MSITPRGMSVQEAYRYFREEKFIVNRRYQRKLVWTETEKAYLIDSMLKGLPIPLILLAERPDKGESGKYEIIDGLQRLNAIFSYIENDFSVNGNFFNVPEFSRAKLLAEAGVFRAETDKQLLSAKDTADLLDYQIAVTIYPATREEEITEIFGRINSGGRQLSAQDRRQAGVINLFSETVRTIAAEIRGDASEEVLPLKDMPKISIDSKRSSQGYGLKAEETFWCKQGILWNSQLRDSEDEEIIADILASILLGEPIARSQEFLDEIYHSDSKIFEKIERALLSYPQEKLISDVKTTLSVLRETIETYNPGPNSLRNIVNPDSPNNPIKTSFYAIFMAFFRLIAQEERSPESANTIMQALYRMQNAMVIRSKYIKTADRIQNIDKTYGLIQRYFIKREPPVLRHGPGLALDLENSLRRSRVETSRYECKQGFYDLSEKRTFDSNMIKKICETICGIANLGPKSEGYIFIGIADKKADADRIATLDLIEPIQIGERFVVGVDREVKLMGTKLDGYIEKIISGIKDSGLTDPLRKQVLTQIDVVEFRGFSIIRIKVPCQSTPSLVGEEGFTRTGSSTEKLTASGLLATSKLFQ